MQKMLKKFQQTEEELNMMKHPNGNDLLATLINLLAEQEGVKITYKLEERK